MRCRAGEGTEVHRRGDGGADAGPHATGGPPHHALLPLPGPAVRVQGRQLRPVARLPALQPGGAGTLAYRMGPTISFLNKGLTH